MSSGGFMGGGGTGFVGPFAKPPPMLYHHLLIALRNLRRHPLHTSINLAGLSIGLTAFLLIVLFVADELNHDRFHADADRIIRVSREWKNQDGETNLHLGAIAPPFLPMMKTQLGEAIEASTRILNIPNPLMSADDRHFQEDGGVMAAEAEFFRVFTFPLIAGDPATALAEANSIVLTRSAAMRYYGATDVVGQTLVFNGSTPLRITAVMEDVPSTSHFMFRALISFRTVELILGETFMTTNYGSNNYYTYLKLAEGVTPVQFQARLPAFIDNLFPANDSGRKASEFNVLHVWPLTSIYLHSNLDSELGVNGDIATVWIYGIIAVFILLIACINFMNLSTARYGDRMREIGVRKVMGADRSSLIRQFLSESVFLALCSLALGLVLMESILPAFNSFTSKEVGLPYLSQPWIVPVLMVLAASVGVFAGSYPALFLSSFDANAILKGELRTGKGPERFRSALVVLQFTISIGLIAAVAIVSAQMRYIQEKDLGLSTSGVFALPSSPEIVARFAVLQSKWRSQPGVMDVSMGSRIPSGRLLDSQQARTEVDGEFVQVPFRIADIHVSHEYLSTFGIPVIAGRDFDPSLASDSLQAFILNETAVSRIGWNSAQAAIGKPFQYGTRSGNVIGVVKDHHFENLRQSVAPIVYMITNGRVSAVAFKVATDRQADVLAYLEEEWAYLRPNYPFTPTIIDEAYATQYESERRLGLLFTWFAGLAVLIACLGLFGLATFSVQRRIKEIGVRKVLGASVSRLVSLLTVGFMRWVLISAFVSVPLVWYWMDRWLDTFAYRTEIGFVPFVIAGSVALVIAAATVVSQTVRAATANPATVLRTE